MTPEQQVCATSRCRHSCLTRCFWSLGMVLLLGAYLTRETVRGPLYTAKACQMNTLGSKPSLLQTEVRPSAYGRCRRMACGNALPRWHHSRNCSAVWRGSASCCCACIQCPGKSGPARRMPCAMLECKKRQPAYTKIVHASKHLRP